MKCPIAIFGKKLPHWGPIWIAATPKGICYIQLGGGLKKVLALFKGKEMTFKPLYQIKSLFCLLERFLEGKHPNIKFRIDFQNGTPFQQRVWKAMRNIPYGKKRTYQWLGHRIGKPRATRAIGQACGVNPIPLVIPCHRVINSDGTLGGFSAGIPWKRKLLQLEGTWGEALRFSHYISTS